MRPIIPRRRGGRRGRRTTLTGREASRRPHRRDPLPLALLRSARLRHRRRGHDTTLDDAVSAAASPPPPARRRPPEPETTAARYAGLPPRPGRRAELLGVLVRPVQGRGADPRAHPASSSRGRRAAPSWAPRTTTAVRRHQFLRENALRYPKSATSARSSRTRSARTSSPRRSCWTRRARSSRSPAASSPTGVPDRAIAKARRRMSLRAPLFVAILGALALAAAPAATPSSARQRHRGRGDVHHLQRPAEHRRVRQADEERREIRRLIAQGLTKHRSRTAWSPSSATAYPRPAQGRRASASPPGSSRSARRRAVAARGDDAALAAPAQTATTQDDGTPALDPADRPGSTRTSRASACSSCSVSRHHQRHLLAAFAVGFVSFISPVRPAARPRLPLGDLRRLADRHPLRGPGYARVLGPATVFCLSFTVMFVALGMTATGLGQTLQDHRDRWTRSPARHHRHGHVLPADPGDPRLNQEWRPDALISRAGPADRSSPASRSRSPGRRASARRWPRARRGLHVDTVGHGGLLLAFYSLGLAIPFLTTAVAFDRATTRFTGCATAT